MMYFREAGSNTTKRRECESVSPLNAIWCVLLTLYLRPILANIIPYTVHVLIYALARALAIGVHNGGYGFTIGCRRGTILP